MFDKPTTPRPRQGRGRGAPHQAMRRPSVEFRVKGIEVAGVQRLFNALQRLAKALEVHNFALAQKADRPYHVRVIHQAQDVVVGGARFLFCRISSHRSVMASPFEAKHIEVKGSPLAACGQIPVVWSTK